MKTLAVAAVVCGVFLYGFTFVATTLGLNVTVDAFGDLVGSVTDSLRGVGDAIF